MIVPCYCYDLDKSSVCYMIVPCYCYDLDKSSVCYMIVPCYYHVRQCLENIFSISEQIRKYQNTLRIVKSDISNHPNRAIKR